MSYCKEYGKDKVIFATKEDHAIPSTVELPQTEQAPGLILANGDINWNCPCLGGMATGPCGVEFREAFSCFHYSESEPKGSDCYDAFKTMQDCFTQYPTVYNKNDDDEDDDFAAMTESAANNDKSITATSSSSANTEDSVGADDGLAEDESANKSQVTKVK